MTDEQLLKTIQNDIKNINKCIEMCDSDDSIDYLKTIQKDMREYELKIAKRGTFKKALKEYQK